MTLATTVLVPVLRGPAATAKILAAIDLLSGGRLLVGLGPGSSARDYELVGVPFEERWTRLEESVQTLRAYWRADDVAFEGALLHCRFTCSHAGTAPRATDLDRELGIGTGTETRGAPCRWLARLRLQHDAGTVRKGLVGRPARARGAWARRCAVPERHRNHVVLCHREPRACGCDARGRTGADAQSPGGAASRDLADRHGGGMRRDGCWRMHVRVPNASSCGPWPMSAGSWRCSANASYRARWERRSMFVT